jgi:hypothetical protein
VTVCLDHQRNARSLDADLDLIEVDFAEVLHLALSALDHRLGRDAAVLLVQRRIERSAVDADANGDLAVTRFRGDRFDVLGLADVARVEAKTLHPGLHRCQCHPVLMVDVGDDRDRRTRHDLGETLRGLLLVAGAPNDVATSSRQCVDLLKRALDVCRLGDRHGLDGDRRATADRDLAHEDLTCCPAFERHLGSVPAQPGGLAKSR